jgi:hypothetical protein
MSCVGAVVVDYSDVSMKEMDLLVPPSEGDYITVAVKLVPYVWSQC